MLRPFITLVIIALALLGTAMAGGTQTLTPRKDALKLVFLLSESLAPDLHFFTRTLAAGKLEGKKFDILVAQSGKPQRAGLTELRLYAWSQAAFRETGVLEEGNVGLSVLVVADIDRDSKGELIYYTPIFDDPKSTGAFIILRKQEDRWQRERYPVPLDAQPQAFVAGRFVDPKLTTLAIDAAWWMPEDPEYAFDDVVFFTWDGKGFRQGPTIRLKYDVQSLVPWDLDGDGREEVLVLGDGTSTYEERHKKCQFEIYGYDVKMKGMKSLAQYVLPFEDCMGDRLVVVRALGHPHLLFIRGHEIYEVKLPTSEETQPTAELRATTHMNTPSVAVGDIDGDGDQELLISAMKFVDGTPERGFFIYKFFSQ